MKIRDLENSLLGKTLELEKQRHVKQEDEKGIEANPRMVGSEQRIAINLSRTILETLDPTKLESESQSKVAKIKKMLEAGTYWSSVNSTDIAKKVEDEINLEILTDKKYVEET